MKIIKRIGLIITTLFLMLVVMNSQIIAEENANESDEGLVVPISIEYGVIKELSFDFSEIDDEGNLYIIYKPDRQYCGHICFDSKYENCLLFINGDEVELISDEKGYVFTLMFSEEPSDVGFTAFGELIVTDDESQPPSEPSENDAVKKLNELYEKINSLNANSQMLRNDSVELYKNAAEFYKNALEYEVQENEQLLENQEEMKARILELELKMEMLENELSSISSELEEQEALNSLDKKQDIPLYLFVLLGILGFVVGLIFNRKTSK